MSRSSTDTNSMPGATGTFYGRESFRPGKILTQIAAIQVFFYFTFAAMLFLLNSTLGVASIYALRRHGPLILDQMLSHRALRLDTSPGLAAVFSFSMSSVLCGSLAFVTVVGRSRRALDFAATSMAAHLLCCSLYGGFPFSALWWGLNIACTGAMTAVCEMLSRRLELRAIAVPTRERDVEVGCGDDDEDAIRPA